MRKRLYEYTPFDGGVYLSCVHGLLSILQLLDNDDRVPWKFYRSESSPTGLSAAVRHSKYGVAKLLLQNRIYHPDESHGHFPALCTAVVDKDKMLVSLLLEHGADPLARCEKGVSATPWHDVFTETLDPSLSKDAFEIFKEMFHKIGGITQRDPVLAASLGFDWKFEGLIRALQANWREASQYLILQGANDVLQTPRRMDFFFQKNQRRSSSLQIAVRYSPFAIVDALLSRSPERYPNALSTSDSLSNTSLVKNRAYVNFLDDHGQTALHYLVSRISRDSKENEKIMTLLLRHGADQTAEDDQRITVSHVAAAIGSSYWVQELMSRGLLLEARSKLDATALHFASEGAPQASEIIRFLTESGLSPIGRDINGNTPLHYAAASCNSQALSELLDVLLRKDGSDLETAKKTIGPQVLGEGAQGASSYRKTLAKYTNIKNHADETLLHVIANKPQIVDTLGQIQYTQNEPKVKETVDFLVYLGSDINALSGGKSPLALMYSSSRMIAAQCLLFRGADPNLSDLSGQTPLHYVADGTMGQRPIVDLLDAGADIEARDHQLRTPLHLAAQGSPRTLRLLIDYGADIESQDITGKRPIHYAIESSQHWNVGILTRKGVDVDARDMFGSTALHLAVIYGSIQPISELILSGANPEAIDNRGRTPLNYAAGYDDAVENMIEFSPEPIQTWLLLFHASEEWCDDKQTRPHTLLKRVSSQILCKERFWDNYDRVKPDLLAQM